MPGLVPRPTLLHATLAGALAVMGGLVTAGCGGTAAPRARPGPTDTLQRYVRAVRQGDAKAAYALLDEPTRQQVSLARFRELMKENRKELQGQAETIAKHTEDGVDPHARIRLERGPDVTLVRAGDTWRVDGGVFEAPVLRTPRDAVLALRHALERRDLRAVERVLSRRTRAEVEAEIARFLEETADEHDLEFDVHGNTATVRTTSGRKVKLRREAGEWHVVDVE